MFEIPWLVYLMQEGFRPGHLLGPPARSASTLTGSYVPSSFHSAWPGPQGPAQPRRQVVKEVKATQGKMGFLEGGGRVGCCSDMEGEEVVWPARSQGSPSRRTRGHSEKSGE